MRSYSEAKKWAEGQRQNPSKSWYNLCQQFCRTAVGAGPYGTTAYKAWLYIPAKYKVLRKPPPAGSIAYYRGGAAGHATFAIENEKCYSNDIKRSGKIDICHYLDPVRQWGMVYLGYIIWTPSGYLDIPSNAKPEPEPPKPEPPVAKYIEDGMYIFRTHQDSEKPGEGVGSGAHYLVTGNVMVQLGGGYQASTDVQVVSSPSEDCDKAMYAAHKDRRYLLNGTVK